jgi:murein DD-endopeptidase MepM/ murein hydrolase activator NlpD
MVLAVATLAATVMLMVEFSGQVEQRQTIHRMEQELAVAREAVGRTEELGARLESMARLQEKLLTMLGVEGVSDAAAESLAVWQNDMPASADVAMRRAAAVTLQPGPERWPATGYVTKEFITGNAARGVLPHPGIDIAAAKDTPILAAGGGTVARAGQDPHLGNYVEIEHGLGYLTVYGHCSRLAVQRGARVETGQVIAYMGASGQATATHLHFEIWRQGEAVDPRTVIDGEPPRD